MLTVEQCYNIAIEKVPADKIVGCTEYDSVVVFEVGKKSAGSKPRNMLWGVNKQTGVGKHFLPFHIPVDEYKKGKRITNFK